MAMHWIEVDDEIMGLLKEQGEPFVDAPNDVLRRLLLKKGRTRSEEGQGNRAIPRKGIVLELPWNTPRALEQTLQVAYLVRTSRRSRSDATRLVAEANRVTPQTVTDKYCRQLGIRAEEFDELLREPELTKLRRLLKNKYPNHEEVIEELLSKGIL